MEFYKFIELLLIILIKLLLFTIYDRKDKDKVKLVNINKEIDKCKNHMI